MDQFKIVKLIWNKLTGRISVSQQRMLDEWVSATEQRKEWFHQLMDEKQVMDELSQMQRFDQAKGWDVIEQRIAPRIKRHNWKLRVAGIAAAVTLLIAVGTIINLWNRTEETVQVAEMQSILPGEFNAVLTIGENQKIVLQDTVNTSIGDNNHTVAKVENGSLAYLAEAGIEPVKMTIEVPQRSEYHFVLSDGSEIWMNAGSKAVFQQPFSAHRRDIYLEGEAFFKVAKDKQRPFVVDICGRNQQEVLGTTFNIKAYPEDQFHQSVLVEGSVLWRTKQGRERIMEPGQLLQYDLEKGQIDVSAVDLYPYIAWTEGRFVFDGTELNGIMDALSRWYGVEVVYADAALKELHFSIDVQRYEELSTILNMLEKTGKIKFECNGNQLIIKH